MNLAAVLEGAAARAAEREAVVDRPTVIEVDPEAPGESAAAQVEPFGNLHASAPYLRNLVCVLVDRAVSRARQRAA